MSVREDKYIVIRVARKKIKTLGNYLNYVCVGNLQIHNINVRYKASRRTTRCCSRRELVKQLTKDTNAVTQSDATTTGQIYTYCKKRTRPHVIELVAK